MEIWMVDWEGNDKLIECSSANVLFVWCYSGMILALNFEIAHNNSRNCLSLWSVNQKYGMKKKKQINETIVLNDSDHSVTVMT